MLLLGPSGYSTTAATYSLGLQLEVPISVQPGILERRGPVFRCLGSIHVLPAPPACSCLTNASANHVLSSYYRRVRPEASRRIGDALKREPVRSAHGCFMWCQSRPSLQNFSEPTLPEQGHEAREEAAALPCREQNKAVATFGSGNALTEEIDALFTWKMERALGGATEWRSIWRLMSGCRAKRTVS